MNAIRHYTMSKAEKKALHAEVSRQAREISDKFALELDATILWTLHEGFGFGAERCKRFYNKVVECREDLLKRYDMEDDAEFILIHKLKEIGIDLREWEKELKNHITFHVR